MPERYYPACPSKGQVTIPKEIRDHLGIKHGYEVEFVLSGEVVALRPLEPEDASHRKAELIRSWADRVRGTLDTHEMTVDQYFDWLRGERDDLGPR